MDGTHQDISAPSGPADSRKISTLITNQIKPLLISISKTTGQGFDSVHGLAESNVIFLFAQSSKDAVRMVGLDPMRSWFGASESDFSSIRTTFVNAPSQSFRFIAAPGHRIKRAIGFVSLALSDADQEKCIARNLLYIMGMKGDVDGTDSAMAEGTSPRELGMLDQFGLGILYAATAKPGVTLRQAMTK